MAAPSDLYVDPAAAPGGNDGSAGNPYASLQELIDNEAWSSYSTNGLQINLKSGTADSYSAAIDWTSTGKLLNSGTPGESSPLIIRGFNTIKNDFDWEDYQSGTGSIAEVIQTGSADVIDMGTADYVWLIDLKLSQNGTGTYCANLDTRSGLIRCELNDASVFGSSGCLTIGCDLAASHGPSVDDIATMITGQLSPALALFSIGNNQNNERGIDANEFSLHLCCSIKGTSTGGTQRGYNLNASGGATICAGLVVEDNQSKGFRFAASNTEMFYADELYANNNGTNYEGLSKTVAEAGDREDPDPNASAWDKSGANTFANRATYFAPKDTIKGEALAAIGFEFWKGAVQKLPAAAPTGGFPFQRYYAGV